ncbi:MAG: hypothetical protein IKP86_03640 [Anaerolineaceae bacterium]|nr:hypothetical protein [Anaerolineaceae bacterium]
MAAKSLHNEKTDALFQIILSLNNIEECYEFFEDLCTVKELSAMVQRYEVAGLLDKGKTFSVITEETGASPATIARVNKCLQYGEGYTKALNRQKKFTDPD